MDFSRSALLTRFDVSLLHSGPMMEKNTMLHNKLISAICISLLSSSCKMLIQHSIILPTATWQPLLFSIVWNQCGWKSHLHLELYACKVRLRKIQIFLLQKAEKTILKRFFSCFKTILHRNQKGNALECKQATKLDYTVCTLLYLAQECVQLSQQKKNMFSKKKVEFWPEMKIWVLRQQLVVREMPSWIGHWK